MSGIGDDDGDGDEGRRESVRMIELMRRKLLALCFSGRQDRELG